VTSEKWLVTNCTLKTASCKRLRSRFRHEPNHEGNRKTFGETKLDFNNEILVDRNSEESGEAFGHLKSAGYRAKTGSSRCKQSCFGTLQDPARHVLGHGRKTLNEFLKAVAALEVFKKGAHRNAGPFENRSSAQNLRIHSDEFSAAHRGILAEMIGRTRLVGDRLNTED